MTQWTDSTGKPVEHAYEYVVTKSTDQDLPVGTQLLDKGPEETKTLHTLGGLGDTPAVVSAKRRRRVCADCLAVTNIVTPYGHGGPHDESTTPMPRDLPEAEAAAL